MAKAISPFDRALNKGLDTPVLAHILTFAGAEKDARAGAVNTAFQKALEVVKGCVCTQLATRSDLEEASREDNAAPERLQTKYNETIQAHVNWFVANPYARFAFGHRGFDTIAHKITELRDNILGEQNVGVKNARSHKLCVDLTRWEGEHRAFMDWMNGRGIFQVAADPNNPMRGLYASLEGILAKENLPERFLRVTRDLNPQAPKYHTQRLAAFHAELREASRGTTVDKERFAQLPADSFSPERFLQAEGIAINAEHQVDFALLSIGQQIARIPGQGEERPVFPHTAAEWRRWFDDGANAPQIQRLLYLIMGASLPPQLWRCTNLRSLEISGYNQNYLTELPDQLEQLPQLTSLSLVGHRFGQVPEVIGRLPQLARLTLCDCQIAELPDFLIDLPHLSYLDVTRNPMRVLPDEIFRHVTQRRFPYLFSEGEMQIDRAHVTRVPFRFWFQENFTLPSFSIIYLDDHGIPIPPLLLDALLFIWFLILNSPVVINPVIFLINWILMNIIEPIVTIFREELDLESEVDVEARVPFLGPIGEELQQRVQALMPDGDNP